MDKIASVMGGFGLNIWHLVIFWLVLVVSIVLWCRDDHRRKTQLFFYTVFVVTFYISSSVICAWQLLEASVGIDLVACLMPTWPIWGWRALDDADIQRISVDWIPKRPIGTPLEISGTPTPLVGGGGDAPCGRRRR